MTRRDSRLRRLLLSVVACLLIGGVFASEIPEELTLTNDTSNDYILRAPTVFKGVQLALPSSALDERLLVSNSRYGARSHFPPAASDAPEPRAESLFILHSVLRT